MFYKAVIKDGETGTKLGFFVSSASPTEAKAEVLCLLANILTQDLDDDEMVVKRLCADGLYRLDLKTGAGKPLREILGGDVVNLDVFVKPAEREPHSSPPCASATEGRTSDTSRPPSRRRS